MSAAGATGLLDHVGTFATDPEELVATTLPLIRTALDAGDAVSTIVDRRTVRVLRDALGDDAGELRFHSPADLLRPRPENLLADLRALAREAVPRRTLLLGQYQPDLDPELMAFWESAATLVLDDLPMTMVCACSRDADEQAVDRARGAHPRLLTADGAVDNPDYRAPADHCPSPSALWGRRTTRLPFHGRPGLGRVRERVAGTAGRLGITGDERDAIVLAVHEAALAACGPEATGTDCVLEIRESPTTLFAEVHGSAAGPPDDDPLRFVGLFSDAATVHDRDGERVVRVLVGTSPPAS